MTSQDFSIEFDLLYNNISSNQAPGLTEYEKSVFLTQAQEALILDLYKGTAGDSFETTEEVTRYLSSLVASKTVPNPTNSLNTFPKFKAYDVSLKSLPDLLFITCQMAKTTNNKIIVIVPTKQDSLFKDLNNPFKGLTSNKALSISEEDKLVVYSTQDIEAVIFKYLKKPSPIVLDNSELTIGNTSTFNVEVPESLHRQILLRAVQMAKAVWAS